MGSGNYFYGCRAWKNCDDGWDGYMRGADDPSTVIENCWAFGNGYLEDGTDPGAQANGNLPHIEYMHLAPGSDLIDEGVNVCQVRVNKVPVSVIRIIKTS